jgi:hypothetical protein
MSANKVVLSTGQSQQDELETVLDAAQQAGEFVCDEVGCREYAAGFDDCAVEFRCNEHLPPASEVRWS